MRPRLTAVLRRSARVLADPDSSSLWWALGFVVWAAAISVSAAIDRSLTAALPSIVLLLAAAAADAFIWWYCAFRWPD